MTGPLARAFAELGETLTWGGSIGRAERVSKDQLRRSHHRREVWECRRRAWRRRLGVFAIPAAIGVALLVHEMTASAPIPAFVALGVMLVVPLLVAAPFDPDGR
jgi:hypothetical protein